MVSIDIDILDELIPDFLTVITQLCASALLFFLMYKLLYKPVKNIMDKRKEYEQKLIKDAETLNEENLEINKQKDGILSNAKKEAEKIISDSQKNAEVLKEEVILEAKENAKKIIEEAYTEAETIKNNALKESKEEIVNIAIETSKKLLNKNISKEEVNKEVETFLKEFSSEE